MDNLKSGIYKITNLKNNKVYYGSAINLKTRFLEHKRQLKKKEHVNNHLQSSFNKYGITCFTFSIILYCSKKDLLFYEQRFLDAYWDGGIQCYNICKTAGSVLGYKMSEETKQKISLSNKGRIKSKEHRDNLSKAHLGKQCSPSAKEKLSKAHSGKTLSLEHKAKIGIKSKGNKYNLGKSLSEETKLKLSIAAKGRKHTEETKAKISASRKKS